MNMTPAKSDTRPLDLEPGSTMVVQSSPRREEISPKNEKMQATHISALQAWMSAVGGGKVNDEEDCSRWN